MRITNKNEVDSIKKDYSVRKNQNFTISIDDDDGYHGPDTYFDGYADVYAATIHVHGKNGKIIRQYGCRITHEALCYYHNGE